MICGGLFDGIGLLAFGLHLAGFEHAWLCEKDEWRRSILAKRWPGVPVFDDVRAVGVRTAGRVDVVAGGFPCKGASSAGRREGFGHPETALWREQLRVVRELRPEYVIVENVANLLGLHDGACFGEVLGDLAALGYDCWWDCFPAAVFGAPHGRDRVFVVAHAEGEGGQGARPGREALERASANGHRPAADAEREPSELRRGAGDMGAAPPRGRRAARQQRAGCAVADCVEAAPADADGPRRSAGREPERQGRGFDGERRRGDADGGSAQDAADTDGDGRQGPAQFDCAALAGLEVGSGSEPAGRGSDFGWGGYEPAVRRWEDLIGRPAPQPLVRRVDDGGARRVERSRLSALGDGVLVQAGWLVGRMIIEHAEALKHRESVPTGSGATDG